MHQPGNYRDDSTALSDVMKTELGAGSAKTTLHTNAGLGFGWCSRRETEGGAGGASGGAFAAAAAALAAAQNGEATEHVRRIDGSSAAVAMEMANANREETKLDSDDEEEVAAAAAAMAPSAGGGGGGGGGGAAGRGDRAVGDAGSED